MIRESISTHNEATWEGNPRQYHKEVNENGKKSRRLYQIADSCG